MTQHTLTVGILGASHIAPLAMIRPARRCGVAIGAVASRRPGAAAAYAKTHNIDRAYDSYDALLTDPSIDLVYNCLPPSEHALWTIAALRAGKDVLCEKPIAMNAAEAREMTKIAVESGRRVIEAFHDRYHPLSGEIDAIRRSGRLGEIVAIEAHFSVNMPFQMGSIRHDPVLGGGALMDLGCYPVHWLRAFTHEEPLIIDARSERNELGADMSIDADLRFPSGISAHLSCSFNGVLPSSTMLIEGRRGVAKIDNLVFPSRGHSIALTIDGLEWNSTVAGGETFDYQLRAIVDSLTTGTELPTEGEDPIRNMEAIDAIYSAAGIDRSWI